MSNTVIRITPFGGFDIPGLEDWLASMAGKGLRFSMTTGPLTWFEKNKPEMLQFHLEPIQGKVEDDPELNALYEEAGWSYLGMFRGSFFVFATPDLAASAHTDPATLDYALKRFFFWKLPSGLILLVLNFLLMGLYYSGAPWKTGLDWFRYFPMEILSSGAALPFVMAAAGFLLIDLSYLLGLFRLVKYRRAVKVGVRSKSHRGAGFLLAAGLLILLPVIINTVQLFFGSSYRPYDLEGSGFLTLKDIEGENTRLSGDPMYNMDYISHSGTLLDPESWYFRQYGSFRESQSPDSVPHLELSITRYPLEILAKLRAEEWTRQYVNGSKDFQALEPAYGLNQILYAPREGRTYTNELTGEVRSFLPGAILVLRRGSTVLHADYYGNQDLTEHLEHLSQMLEQL